MKLHHIPKFEDKQLQEIADDCGLILPFDNLKIIDAEIEFFAEQVWKAAVNHAYALAPSETKEK